MTIRIKICKDEDSKKWNDFVNNSPFGDILQFWEWGEVKKNEGWRPLRIAIIDEQENSEKWLIVAQILLKKVSFLGNYAYVPNGPVFYEKSDLKLALPKLKEFLVLNSKAYNFLCLEIEPKIGKLIDLISSDKNQVSKEKILEENPNLKPLVDEEILIIFAKAGYKITGRNMQPKYKLYYDLQNTEDWLLGQCHKSTRYNIKLAQKKAVQITEYQADDSNILNKLQAFYDLLLKTQRRAKGYPIRPLSSFQKMFNLFANNQKTTETKIEKEPLPTKETTDINNFKTRDKPILEQTTILETHSSNKSKVIFRDGIIIKNYHPTSFQSKENTCQNTFEKSKVNLEELQKPTGYISLFESSFENIIIAMNITFRTNFWSSSFYAASNREHPQTKAPYLLRWSSIIQAKKFGSKVYDFWGIIPNNIEHQGYSDNKLSFGGVRIDNIGILSLPLKPFKYKIWHWSIKIRTRLKKIYLRLNGKFLKVSFCSKIL